MASTKPEVHTCLRLCTRDIRDGNIPTVTPMILMSGEVMNFTYLVSGSRISMMATAKPEIHVSRLIDIVADDSNHGVSLLHDSNG